MNDDDVVALSTTDTVNARLRLLIIAQIPKQRGRFPKLESITGIPETTFLSWFRRGTEPSIAIVTAISKAWPEYAFWLVTGLNGEGREHKKPQILLVTP